MTLIQVTLFAAALFNFVVAYMLALPAASLGAAFDLPVGVPVLYLALSSGFVALFGFAYFWMGIWGVRKSLLFFSACAKSSAFTLAVLLWALDQTGLKVVVLASGDIIVAVVWFWWLARASEDIAD